MNAYAKQKQTHKYRKQTSGYQTEEGSGGGTNQGYGINRHKLLCIKQISNKLSQGITPMNLVITCNGVYLQKY